MTSQDRTVNGSDVTALIAELRGFAAGSDSARATLMRDAADALEKAQAPTDDEREALARLIQAAKDMRSWFTKKADTVLGRIKTDTHEDVMLYHDAVSILVTARQMIGLLADSKVPDLQRKTVIERHDLVMPIYDEPEPQGEPSDAQVLAARNAYQEAHEANYDFEDCIHAALRAAGGAR